MANPQIIVEYLAQTAGLSKATGEIESGGSRVKSVMGSVGKAVTAGLAVGAVVAFGKASVAAAEESQQATSRLDAVFKAMGDSTGQASKAAQAYASTLSKQIGVEDEVIMKGQAMLATFKSVSSESARQAGIFDRATAAAADLAAAGFGSIESNAVQLGKALQDPVKGLTALGRAGVTFTAAQREQIKALEESGRHLEAQKIVLAAIEGQVKGTAAATATESQKMSVAFGEVQESIGMMLLPALQTLGPVLADVAGFMAENASVVGPLIAALAGLAAIVKVVTLAQVAWNLAITANPIGIIIVAIAALVAGLVILYQKSSTARAIMQAMWDAMRTAGIAAFNAFKAAVGFVQSAIQALTSAYQNHRTIILAVAAVIGGPVVAALVAARFAIKNMDAALDAVKAAIAAVRSAASSLASYLSGAFAAAARTARSALDGLIGVASSIAGAFSSAAAAVRDLASAIASIPSRIHIPNIPNIPGFGRMAPMPPTVPELGRGGVVNRPTLALVGERQGREIVTPERLLRSIVGEARSLPNVRVFIGDQELRGLVRVEVDDATTGLARTLLAGAS